MSILQLAFIFFIIANPIGNSPVIVSLVSRYPLKKQQKILLRESIFALVLAVFFLFLGDAFLNRFSIQNYSLNISGGILLLVVAINMIFSKAETEESSALKQEPFIVPIATPLLSGAGLLTMIMLYSKQEADHLKLLIALLIAWVPLIAALVFAPYLQVLFGKRGMLALEQLMGLLTALIAMEMIVKGSSLFMQALSTI